MNIDDYRLFPLPVFVVSSKNGRIIGNNPYAMAAGFHIKASFFDMIADKSVFALFIKKGVDPLIADTTMMINGKAYNAVIKAVLTEYNGEAVYLIVLTDIREATKLSDEAMIAAITDAYRFDAKNPALDFLRITATATGAFCASLYEKKSGRYKLSDEWRTKKSICIPMLSADADTAINKEIERLKSLKHADDVVVASFKKAHGTKGMLVCFFNTKADDNNRCRIDRMATVYALVSPDLWDNNEMAVLKGLDTAEQGIAVWDKDTKGLLYENKMFREKFGTGAAKPLLSRLQSGDKLTTELSTDNEECTGKSYGITQSKTRFGRRSIVTAIVNDVTKYKQAESKLEVLAKTDILTGLNNRRAGLQILEAAYVKCKRERKPLTVCFADIDGLKSINDTYGHGVGDNMIRAVAIILKKQMDTMGEVCRLGGDEFLLILPGIKKAQAMLLTSNIKQAISRTFVSEKQSISMSFGFKEAEYNANETVYTLVNTADSDMYKEKRSKA